MEQDREPEEGVEGVEGITDLLHVWAEGDIAALDQVVPLIYAELRRVAQTQFSGGANEYDMQATEMVDLAYMRLRENCHIRFDSRKHFFWYACQVIRRIMVDQVRSRLSQKRGGGLLESLEEAIDPEQFLVTQPDSPIVLALDQALSRLEKINPQQCRIVEMHAYAGMTIEEIGDILEVSHSTAKREWRAAKRWLFFELNRK